MLLVKVFVEDLIKVFVEFHQKVKVLNEDLNEVFNEDLFYGTALRTIPFLVILILVKRVSVRKDILCITTFAFICLAVLPSVIRALATNNFSLWRWMNKRSLELRQSVFLPSRMAKPPSS